MTVFVDLCGFLRVYSDMKDQSTHSHRELELLAALRRLGGSARSADLARLLDVSEETVRRAIKSLAKAGVLQRVHGGAHLSGSQGDSSFFQRISEYSKQKRAIAKAVPDLIDRGLTVFLDVGSTTAFIAEELSLRSDLTFVTNSISVAQTLVSHEGNRVHILGGEMQNNERGAFGHVTETQARRYSYDVAILSADALSVRSGPLYLNAAEASLSEVVAECANQIILPVDHHKFNALAPHRGIDPQRVDVLLADQAPSADLATALQNWDVTLTICDGKT
ncbi:DeoR/GlpR family DNA-binding transcription regulator [Roseovarius sp. EL26]|uniref:DeoR/GlpR family DNA-binding transcription regulator n=1 Tax=Roseovarius sp. EL26 TaxID=2126672 RepID=UPI00349F5371